VDSGFARFHGTTAESGGKLPAGSTDLTDVVKIRQEDDRLTSLPADITLATINNEPVTLRIER
jgi:hypothetical protein